MLSTRNFKSLARQSLLFVVNLKDSQWKVDITSGTEERMKTPVSYDLPLQSVIFSNLPEIQKRFSLQFSQSYEAVALQESRLPWGKYQHLIQERQNNFETVLWFKSDREFQDKRGHRRLSLSESSWWEFYLRIPSVLGRQTEHSEQACQGHLPPW